MIAAAVVLLAPLAAAAPTYYRDALPIIIKRCQACHRPGEIGPMPLRTYRETRPWAKAIREAVLTRRMPPWHADPRVGRFANDLSMSDGEIHTLAEWIDAGAPEGSPEDAPPAPVFTGGWRIPKPDAVFSIPEASQIPATGTLDYRYITVPTGFTEDKWVEAAEVRPSNRSVVHHAIVYVVSPGGEDSWMSARGFLAGYAPGSMPQKWKSGQARLVPAGSHLMFQLHYTPNGRAGADRTQVGLVFARRRPHRQIVAITAGNRWFEIPPGDGAHRVDSQVAIRNDALLVGMRPHMHLRGKSFEYRVVTPDGASQVVLRVPRYDFNWQPYYYLETPIALPAGSRIECTAQFDNSASNPRNPDPRATVRWGEQSWEEMMLGWIDLAVEVHGTIGR
ncbi:MAG: thiol-disulfide isomerase [Bryobacteraceae bacterium]